MISYTLGLSYYYHDISYIVEEWKNCCSGTRRKILKIILCMDGVGEWATTSTWIGKVIK